MLAETLAPAPEANADFTATLQPSAAPLTVSGALAAYDVALAHFKEAKLAAHAAGDAAKAAEAEISAEEPGGAAHKRFAKAKRAWQSKSKAFCAAVEACNKARAAILTVPADTVQAALEKQAAYLKTLDASIAAGGRIEPGNTKGAPFCLGSIESGDENLAHEALLRDLAQLPALAPEAPKARAGEFAAAAEQYLATRDLLLQAEADHATAWAAYQAEAPVPAELVDPTGGYYSDAEEIGAAKMPFQKKLAAIAILEEWLPRRRAAAEQLTAPDEALNEADQAHYDAYRALMQTPATSPAEVALQAKALLDHEYLTEEGESADDPLELSRLLTENGTGEAAVRLYLSALAASGAAAPKVEPFDAGAWIARFEALPGCSVTMAGATWKDAAWEGYLGFEPFTVRDPQRIEYALERRPDYAGSSIEHVRRVGFIMGSKESINDVFADDPAEAERLCALWDDQQRILKGAPRGYELWSALAPWQKKCVTAFARCVERYRDSAEQWLAEWQAAGGMAGVNSDGETFYGGPVPPAGDSPRAKLRADIEGNAYLKAATRSLIREKHDNQRKRLNAYSLVKAQ